MRRSIPFALLLGTLPTMLACAADKPRAAPLPVDCSVNSLYDFKPIYPFEVGQTGWYQSGDCTGGHWDPHPLVPGADGGTTLSDAGACVFDPSVASPNKGNVPLERIAEGDRCGSQWAAYIQSYGHRDWGSLFGTWDLGANIPPANGDGYEGVSFWARNPSGTGHARGPTNKTIWFMVGDWRQVVAGNSTTPYPPVDDYRCVPAPNDASVDSYNSNNQVSSGSRSPAPNECGNYFRTRVETTEDWALYLLPWSVLYQEPTPNREAGGIDPSDVRLLRVSIPVGATVELWLDDIAFYRRRVADAGD
jgi:hypothetical protein